MFSDTDRIVRRLQSDRLKAAFIIQLVAMTTGVPAREIVYCSRRGGPASRARQIAMYLAYVIFQWPLHRVGQAFGRDRTTAGYACRNVEDLRDDPDFDAELERMEACLKASPADPAWLEEGA